MSRFMKRYRSWLLPVTGLVVYLICSLIWLNSWPPPDLDEGIFANPALNLIQHGNFGSSAMTGVFGMGKVTFWFLPLYPLLLTIPILLFGFHLWSIRLLSVVVGLATLFVLQRLSRALGASEKGAGLLMILLGTSYFYLDVARLGRMEVLLGFLISAELLCLVRARSSQRWSLFVLAGILSGAALLTHPLGVVAVLALFIWCFPDRRGAEGQRDWRGSMRQLALALGAMGATLLPFVFFVLHKGAGEFWQQIVVYQRYCYIRQGFLGGPLDHARELWRLLRSTITWGFMVANVFLLSWLAWPLRASRRLGLLVVSSLMLMIFAYPSTYINYWIPVVYIPLAIGAAIEKLSALPSDAQTRYPRLQKAAVAAAFVVIVVSNLYVHSRRLMQFRGYDPDRVMADIHDLVETKAPRSKRILGSSTFLFAFPDKDLHAVFAVASAIDLRGVSWRQALAEVSPEVIIVDGQLASGVWPAFSAPPDGMQGFLSRNGRFLGAVKSNVSSSPIDADVYAVDPRIFRGGKDSPENHLGHPLAVVP